MVEVYPALWKHAYAITSHHAHLDRSAVLRLRDFLPSLAKRLVAKEHYSKPATDALIAGMAAEIDIAIAAVGG